MAVADTAKLIVDLSLKGNFARQLGLASKATKNFDRDASRAYKAGSQIGTGIKRGAAIAAAGVGILATQVGFGLDQLIELEKLTTQTNAALKSTKGVSGQTADSIRNLAEKYESLNATIDDKVIQSGENLLLTFTAIRKEAFEPALNAALDMSVALGKDLNTSVLMLGKALQDPIKGVTALGRAGVDVRSLKPKIEETMSLTKEEAKRWEALSKQDKKAGKRYLDGLRQEKTLKAQKLILAELNTEFGGSFLAGGTTTEAKVAKFGDAIEEVQKQLAVALLPTVSNVADALTELLLDPEVQDGARKLGESIGEMFTKENIKSGIGAIKEGAGVLLTVAQQVGGIVKTAVGVFQSLPPELQKLAVGAFVVNKLTGGLVTNLAGGLISAVLGAFKGVMNVNAGVVNVNGGVGGGGGLPGKIAGAAAGAAGIGLGTVGALVIAPASIAALGIVITNAIDPTHARSTAGKAATASARGVPDWNNRALQQLHAINQNTQDLDRPKTSGPAADKQRAAIEKVQTQVESMKGRIATELATNKKAVDDSKARITAAQQETRRETARGDALVRAQTQSSGAAIVAAINGIDVRPQVNVSVSPTTINKITTVTNRYGTQIGSRGQDAFDGTRPR